MGACFVGSWPGFVVSGVDLVKKGASFAGLEAGFVELESGFLGSEASLEGSVVSCLLKGVRSIVTSGEDLNEPDPGFLGTRGSLLAPVPPAFLSNPPLPLLPKEFESNRDPERPPKPRN